MSRIVARKDLARARDAARAHLAEAARAALVDKLLAGVALPAALEEVRAKREAAETAIAGAGDAAAIEAAARVDWEGQ